MAIIHKEIDFCVTIWAGLDGTSEGDFGRNLISFARLD